MKNVFDYNITPDECRYFGIHEKREDYEAFEAEFGDNDTINCHLAHLMWLRGYTEEATKFINRVKKSAPDMYNDFWRTVKHP